MGLNITLSPNLSGSSDADFYKDSESGLNSKIKKNTKESFVQATVELHVLTTYVYRRNVFRKLKKVKSGDGGYF